jgi:D-alanine-D-alanine ligase
MIVGLAYDLRSERMAQGMSAEDAAEFDSEATIQALEETLQAMDLDTVRIGGMEQLTERLVRCERWDLVFNIAEGVRGFGREAQVPALLEAWGAPYTFSDPLALCLCLHKGMAKRVVRDYGLPTPDFAVVESPRDIDKVRLAYPLFCKPVAEGTSKGVTARSRVETSRELEAVCLDLLERFRQPVLVERFLPGREFTVGLVGQGDSAEALGVMEVKLPRDVENGAYGYESKERYETLVEYKLVMDRQALQAADLAVEAWKALGCRDAGRVDVRLDEKGKVSFIEANPLPGLNPVRSDLPILCRLVQVPYQELIASIISSAVIRSQLMQRAA